MEEEAQPEEVLQKDKRKGNAHRLPGWPEELSLEAVCGEEAGALTAVPRVGTPQTALGTAAAPGARPRRGKCRTAGAQHRRP